MQCTTELQVSVDQTSDGNLTTNKNILFTNNLSRSNVQIIIRISSSMQQGSKTFSACNMNAFGPAISALIINN